MNKIALPATIYRALVSLVLTLGMLQPLISSAADWNIDHLMQSLAKTGSGRATFVETKYFAMLNRPVESSGDLLYTAPDHLEKRTFKPKPETMRIDGETLAIERGRQKFSVQLQEYPELAAFIDSIRGTLAGNRAVLERSFKLKLEGNSGRWMITLLPTDAKMSRTIHLIRIAGTQDNVRSIEIIQTDGDRSVMTIKRVATP